MQHHDDAAEHGSTPQGPNSARARHRGCAFGAAGAGFAFALLILTGFAVSAVAQPCDLQGTWHIDVGAGTGSVIIVDDGSGTLTGLGELVGDDFTMGAGSYAHPAVEFDLVDGILPLHFTGTTSGCDTLTGQMLNGGSPFLPGTLTRLRNDYCGDGTHQAAAGEQCDDGNFVDGDDCPNTCTLPACGDGDLDPFEECDLGPANAPAGACLPTCAWATCGDGVRLTGTIPPGAPVTPEACDAGSGNTNLPNAACRPDCTTLFCGDGIRDDANGERCDEGGSMPSATCDASCTVPGLARGIEYALTDLSTTLGLGGFATQVNLNELGQVAGYYDDDGSGTTRAFFWTGSGVTLIPSPHPDGGSFAFGLNETGQVVGGMSVLPSGDEHAFLWSDGVLTDIQPLGTSGYAYDVNRSGHAVGVAKYSGSLYRGFLWDGVAATELGTFPGGTLSEALAINDRGDVALTGNTPPLLQQRSLLLRDGAWIDVGTLGGQSSTTWGLSNAGHVAGDSSRADGSGRAFLYDGAAMIDLGVLAGNRSSARAVNSAGQVVGYSSVAGGGTDHAFLHDCRGMTDLNDLIASPSGYLLDARDWRINEAGQIAGVAVHVATLAERAVLLNPLPFCGNCRVTPASGEQCDDGNTIDGDGCSAACQLEATPPVSGTGTVSSGATATPSQPAQAEVTSPSGGTVSIERTTGSSGTTGLQVLGVRFVVEAPVETPEAPLVLDFLLDPSLLPPGLAAESIQILRNGTVVDDCSGPAPHTVASPDPCISSRTIVAGGDVRIRALSSAASEWAFAAEVCPPAPDPACLAPIAPRKSTLAVKRGTTPDKDSLVWTWTAGAATSVADFGNPRGAGRIAACMYDTSSGSPKLVEVLQVPAGGTCGNKPCWKGTKKGFDYTDRAGAADGVGKLTLASGATGKSKVVLRAKGAALPLPQLPLAAPVTVQLRTAADRCFGATFTTPSPVRDPSKEFKAKSG